MSEIAAEIERVLWRCKTVDEVNATALHYSEAVALMSADPELKVRAIIIKNMASYMRDKIMGRLRDKPR